MPLTVRDFYTIKSLVEYNSRAAFNDSESPALLTFYRLKDLFEKDYRWQQSSPADRVIYDWFNDMYNRPRETIFRAQVHIVGLDFSTIRYYIRLYLLKVLHHHATETDPGLLTSNLTWFKTQFGKLATLWETTIPQIAKDSDEFAKMQIQSAQQLRQMQDELHRTRPDSKEFLISVGMVSAVNALATINGIIRRRLDEDNPLKETMESFSYMMTFVVIIGTLNVIRILFCHLRTLFRLQPLQSSFRASRMLLNLHYPVPAPTEAAGINEHGLVNDVLPKPAVATVSVAKTLRLRTIGGAASSSSEATPSPTVRLSRSF